MAAKPKPPATEGELQEMLTDPGELAVRNSGQFSAPDDPRRHKHPAHIPTPENRVKVEAYSAIGVPHAQIAILIGISEPTLNKYYEAELASGAAQGVAKVANTLFTRATTGKDLGAAIFYLKAKAGWSEKQTVVHEGGSKPVTLNIITGFDQNVGRSDS